MLENGKIVMTGVIQDKMYRLFIEIVHDEHEPAALEMTLVASFGVPTTTEVCHLLDVWHRRFLHTNHTTFKQMATQGLVDGMVITQRERSFCPGCVMGSNTEICSHIMTTGNAQKHQETSSTLTCATRSLLLQFTGLYHFPSLKTTSLVSWSTNVWKPNPKPLNRLSGSQPSNYVKVATQSRSSVAIEALSSLVVFSDSSWKLTTSSRS